MRGYILETWYFLFRDGIFVRITKNRTHCLKAPWADIGFSERNGYDVPKWKLLGFRFFTKDRTPKC